MRRGSKEEYRKICNVCTGTVLRKYFQTGILILLSSWTSHIQTPVMEFPITEIIKYPHGLKCGASDGYFNIRTLYLLVNITVCYS